MKTRTLFPTVAVLFAAFTITNQSSAQVIATSDNFGSGPNAFAIDFVGVGNAGNSADTTGYGAVPYEYRIGTYEISQDAITKATAGGLANVNSGPYAGNQPAATISWYEAAAFVNWLNTSTGRQAAYNLTFSGTWSMTLWSSADAWQVGGENLYRHKNAYYFLPSENEWYKSAYYTAAGSGYFLYPTGSNATPTAVAGGTVANTAVYGSAGLTAANVNNAGGLSPYGTMAQGGNVDEWSESAFGGANSSPTEFRSSRGGDYFDADVSYLSSGFREFRSPDDESAFVGFRVASVPEPSTYALILLGAGALLGLKRRKATNKK